MGLRRQFAPLPTCLVPHNNPQRFIANYIQSEKA